MKVFLLIAAVVYVCTVATSTTTTAPDVSPSFADPEVNDVKDKSELHDGIDLNTLTEKELEELADAEDEEFVGQLDLLGIEAGLKNKVRRPKRWVPVAMAIGRALLSGAVRRGITRSGARLTRHYVKQGGYRSALRDFSRLGARGTKPIRGNNGLRGYTGRMGNHRVTVRNSSSNGRPTLEIRSPRRGGGSTVRKIRY